MTTILAAALLAAQTACGGPVAAPSATPSPACRPLKISSDTESLTATDTPTAGFSLPINSQPVGIIRDRDGVSVWLLATGLDRVMHVDATGMATEYQLPHSGLGIQLSQASDGTVWVPEQIRNAVASIAPDGSAQECTLPRKHSEPMATSVGADGSVWVSEANGAAIARLQQGHFTEYPIAPPAAKAAEVLAGSDGGAWFSVMGAPELGHITASGKIERIALGGSSSYLGLLETPDGSIWVADFDGDRVIRVGKDGTKFTWQAPSGAKPQGLALGPAGVVWVTESGIDRIASVRGSALVEGYKTGSWPDHLAITTDGSAWFTEYNQDGLGRVPLPPT